MLGNHGSFQPNSSHKIPVSTVGEVACMMHEACYNSEVCRLCSLMSRYVFGERHPSDETASERGSMSTVIALRCRAFDAAYIDLEECCSCFRLLSIVWSATQAWVFLQCPLTDLAL